MYFKTEGVILSSRNFSEADKILNVFTRDYGKMSCIAKGVRRPKSKKVGHAQSGNWCKIFVAKGKNIDVLTEIEVKRPFGFENLTLAKIAQIYHLLELVDFLTEQNQKNSQAFYLLINFLEKINQNSNFQLLLAVFKVKLLNSLGFFSNQYLKNSKNREFFKIIQEEDFKDIEAKINLSNQNYLKLLVFLDSIVENLAQRKLKTSRFAYGQI